MAINYTNLFTTFGEVIKQVNLLETLAKTTLPGYRDAIVTDFQAESQDELAEGLFADFNSFTSQADSWQNRVAAYVTRRLQADSLVAELNLPNNNINDLLRALIARMNDDSEDVKPCAVTLGSATADGANTGNGTVHLTKVLDGAASPIRNFPHAEYATLDSELAVPSETMTLVCVGDRFGGASEGSERFRLYGEQGISGLGSGTEGSGNGPTIQVANARGIVKNPSFENGSSNTPSNWTISSGTAGTHVFLDATDAYRGSQCLELQGDGTQASIKLEQSISTSLLIPRRRYLFGVLVKSSSATGASATVQFEGTGYTASSSEKISIASGALPTSYTLQTFYLPMPASIPSDFKLTIEIAGTPTNGLEVRFDSIAFQEVNYFGGIGVNVTAGSTPFIVGDKSTWTVANDQSGKFQDFFRRMFGVQLPSDASPSISDTLAGGS